MDRLLDAMRRFSESRTDQDPQVPHLSRSLEQHARLISERVSLTAIDGGSALIARRSNAAIGIVKIASVRYDHPGMQVHVVRWVVRVFAGEDSFEVSMLCLDSDEERSVAFGALDGDGVMRDPEQGIDLARALLERERQKEAVGLVLADGSLQPRFVEERAACAALEKSVLGIVKKASHARVSAPESMVARFSEPVFAHRIDGSWYCRLHPSSSRIIRVEGAAILMRSCSPIASLGSATESLDPSRSNPPRVMVLTSVRSTTFSIRSNDRFLNVDRKRAGCASAQLPRTGRFRSLWPCPVRCS